MPSPDPTAARVFRAAVIGSPIGHSKSPLLHAAAYRLLDVDCSYSAIEVDEESLDAFVRDVRSSPHWRGLSVTMPLKSAMARLVDHSDHLSQVLGVVNTVVVEDDGGGCVLTGHNTDVVGVANALIGAGVDTAERAVVLGGGGTAAAAIAGLARLGASSARVVVRRPEASAGLGRIGAELGLDVDLVEWRSAGAAVQSADVVISTLPPRAADPLAGELVDSGFRTQGTLLDVAYDPWPSAIAAAFSSAGGTIVPGLDMLLHQAVEQVRLFFPDTPQDRAGVLNVMCDAVGVPRR
ncbi:shikimate dehydrogenase [Arthrobacter sp. B1805]|uniref:shikimate dehydrogenase n=1 Tax=Arthrobacter sp. B1805 TaxID=2058892 RepID=UPI00215829CF|nr:shikimate dehydrogenase [Arthrobacter sp. B1805]